MENQGFGVSDNPDGVRARSQSGKESALSSSSQKDLIGDQQRVADAPDGVEKVALKKNVGLVSGVALIVGTIIGSGIFISPVGVLRGTGSVGLSMIVWAGCGLIAMLGSISYMELGTFIKLSGGEYAYLKQGFGSVPAFLYAWVSVVVIRPSSMAIICLTFAEYSLDPFYDDCGPPTVTKKLLASCAILAVTAVNCLDVKLATRVQVFFTGAKLVAIAVIIGGGIYLLANSKIGDLDKGLSGSETNPSTIALAFYDGLWAYDGWNQLNLVTEEIKDPKKNLPRAILIAIPLVTICYILVNISYFASMQTTEMLATPAVGLLWAQRVLKGAAVIIPISVAFSTFGAANGTMFTGGRIAFAAAREGHLPSIISMVHVRRYTPTPPLILTAAISILMIIPGDIFTLIDFFSFTAWLGYGATFLALIVMRFTHKDVKRPVKVPILIPVICLLVSLYLVVAPIIDNPQIELLYAALFVVAGLIFYVPFVHFKLHPRFLDKITAFLQLYMEVVPPSLKPEM